MKADFSIRKRLFAYAKDAYGTDPDFPWEDDPDNAVLRHERSHKWYALFFPVPREKFGLSGGVVDVLNVKCDPLEAGSLAQKDGVYPAYHMNKKHWISILLDGSVPEEEVRLFLDESYGLTE